MKKALIAVAAVLLAACPSQMLGFDSMTDEQFQQTTALWAGDVQDLATAAAEEGRLDAEETMKVVLALRGIASGTLAGSIAQFVEVDGFEGAALRILVRRLDSTLEMSEAFSEAGPTPRGAAFMNAMADALERALPDPQ